MTGVQTCALPISIENERLIDQYEDRGTYVINIKTDGWYYYSYSSSWRVSSDFGDLDGDQFFCKIKIMTWAEIEELAAMLGQGFIPTLLGLYTRIVCSE